MNDEAVYRTAPATPGLLIMVVLFDSTWKLILKSSLNIFLMTLTTWTIQMHKTIPKSFQPAI